VFFDVASLVLAASEDPDFAEAMRFNRRAIGDVLNHGLKPWDIHWGELRTLLARFPRREDWAGKPKADLREIKRQAGLVPPEVRV
jgi:hypothetical protein